MITTNIVLPNESETIYFIQVTDNETKKKGYVGIKDDEIVIHAEIGADSIQFAKQDKARFFINKMMKNTNARVITNHEYLSQLDLSKYEQVDSDDLYCLTDKNGENYVHYSVEEEMYLLGMKRIGACVFTSEQADALIESASEAEFPLTIKKELLPKKVEYRPKASKEKGIWKEYSGNEKGKQTKRRWELINDYHLTFLITSKEDFETMDKTVFCVLSENELYGLIHATQKQEATFFTCLFSLLIAVVIAILNISISPFPEYRSIINILPMLFTSIGFFLFGMGYETEKKIKVFMDEIKNRRMK